jgi:hypothetical protein
LRVTHRSVARLRATSRDQRSGCGFLLLWRVGFGALRSASGAWQGRGRRWSPRRVTVAVCRIVGGAGRSVGARSLSAPTVLRGPCRVRFGGGERGGTGVVVGLGCRGGSSERRRRPSSARGCRHGGGTVRRRPRVARPRAVGLGVVLGLRCSGGAGDRARIGVVRRPPRHVAWIGGVTCRPWSGCVAL